jgi:hypothetical protein
METIGAKSASNFGNPIRIAKEKPKPEALPKIANV